MLVVTLALALFVPLQPSAAESAPPPPEPLSAPDEPLSPVVIEPEDAAPPPAMLTPAPKPTPTRPRVVNPERKRAPPPVDGLDDAMVGFLQWLVPCGIVVIGLPCLSVSAYFCAPIGVGFCMLPAVNGYLATYIGDRFGKNRAPAVWPVVAAYAGTAISLVGGVVFFALLNGVAGTAGNPLGNPVFLGMLGGIAGLAAAATIAVPVAYTLSSEPKRPGDDGFEAPGWFAPNHPKPLRKRIDRNDPPPQLAMRF